jgi:hypothetical protein
MSETLYYCKNCDCEISECPYNLEHLDPRTFDKCKVVHLEDNPNYCKKPNWYGYQVKGAENEV